MKRRELLKSRIGAVVVALVVAGAAAGTARADDKLDQARGHYQRGVALFDQHQYKEAIAEFAAADGLSPSPILEYNMALCYDRLGDRAEALRRYRLYLKRVPDAKNRSQVEAKIARLEKEIAAANESAASDPGYEPLPDSGDNPSSADHGASASAGAAAGSAGSAGAPPDSGADGGAAAGTSEPTPAPNDPELARAAKVDVGSIRDERGFGGAQGAEAASGEPAETGAPPPAPPDNPEPEPKPKPVYKKWWFWVVVGVSAFILIEIATSGPNSNSTQPAVMRALDPSLSRSMPGPGSGGLTLRF